MFSILRSSLLAPCLILFGIFLVFAGYKNEMEDAAMEDRGVATRAEVTKLEWKEKRGADNSYTAHLSFTIQDGAQIARKASVSTSFGRALRNGETKPYLDIVYLPESPTTFREAGVADSSDAQKDVGYGMLMAGVGIIVLRLLFGRRHMEA